MKSPYASKFLETGGFKTHYIEQGAGDVVILIHGGGPGADCFGNWFGCMPVFAKNYRTIAIDMVGYGRSEAHEGYVYSQANRNQQLVNFIEALDLGAVNLVGNSMGGATSLGAAMLRPDLVKNMVLMGSAGLDHLVGKVGEAAKPMAAFDYTIEAMKRVMDRLGGAHYQPVSGLLDYRHELASRPERRASNEKISAWIQGNQGLHYEEAAIATVKTRTLVFQGKNDPLVVMQQGFKFLELLDNSTGYFLPKCGHWAMLEHPDIFTRETLQFLGDDSRG